MHNFKNSDRTGAISEPLTGHRKTLIQSYICLRKYIIQWVKGLKKTNGTSKEKK